MTPMLTILAALLQAASPPAAEPRPAPSCGPIDASLPAELSGWTRSGERLVAGHAVTLQAGPASGESGGRPGGTATIAFSVPMTGTYGIALDQAGWIDIEPVMDRAPGRPLTSVGHGHGPACTTIRKIVRFDLTAGVYYSLSLSGLPNPTARVMIVPPAPPAPPTAPEPHAH